MGEFALSSDAFGQGDQIPLAACLRRRGVSPVLAWSDPPAQTRALALIIEDPDAPVGTFTHWLA